jgi:hypothetical protein
VSTIYDQFGRPRFYFAERAVYEHGSGRLVHVCPNIPRGANGGLPAWWIDGAALDPQLRGQQFYYDAEDEPPIPDKVQLPQTRDRRSRYGKRRRPTWR